MNDYQIKTNNLDKADQAWQEFVALLLGTFISGCLVYGCEKANIPEQPINPVSEIVESQYLK